MKNFYFTAFMLIIFIHISNSQSENLCPGLQEFIKFEDSNNVPVVATNTEEATVTLTFNQQDITDIFADYIIYDFYQTFPGGSENLQKIYTIVFNSKDLFNEIDAQIPADIIQVDLTYSSTSLDQNIIDFLDGKQFRYERNCSDVPEIGETCSDNEQVMDNTFNLLVSFTYDSINDLLKMQSNVTPCGNTFDITLKGGEEINKLQFWEYNSGTVAQNPSCNFAETFFNEFMDIGCFENSHYGDIDYTIDIDNNTVVLGRNTTIFSYDYITLNFNALSLQKNDFENIELVYSKKTDFINFTNITNSFEIEIYSSTGQNVLSRRDYENNSINLNSFSVGLYFIKLFNDNNQYTTYKFLNR